MQSSNSGLEVFKKLVIFFFAGGECHEPTSRVIVEVGFDSDPFVFLVWIVFDDKLNGLFFIFFFLQLPCLLDWSY